jgi:hypothetical protein
VPMEGRDCGMETRWASVPSVKMLSTGNTPTWVRSHRWYGRAEAGGAPRRTCSPSAGSIAIDPRRCLTIEAAVSFENKEQALRWVSITRSQSSAACSRTPKPA